MGWRGRRITSTEPTIEYGRNASSPGTIGQVQDHADDDQRTEDDRARTT